MRTRFAIFSDLDGTLLDHHTYSFEAALPVLKKVKSRQIPVILITSKTRAETEAISRKMGLNYPFIVENGGAIFIPRRHFNLEGMKKLSKGVYEVIQLGVPYRRIRRALKMIRDQANIRLVGFSDLKPSQVASISGLDQNTARLAKKREYDEPFILEQPGRIKEIRIRAREFGLQVVKGGRFYHLIGNNDKGKAVRILKDLYERKYGSIKSIGLGDSSNDLPMLKEVDIPVLIRRADGKYEKLPELKSLVKTKHSGPNGWAEAINKILDIR